MSVEVDILIAAMSVEGDPLSEHPEAEDCLEDVVGLHQASQLEGLSLLHHPEVILIVGTLLHLITLVPGP